MIFISLVVGICAIEDLRSLSTIGMATPRIPGGIIASCTIMFSQLGLTTDQLGIIMAANVLVLYLDTAVAAITRCCCAINSAKKQGYIDLDILKNPNIY